MPKTRPPRVLPEPKQSAIDAIPPDAAAPFEGKEVTVQRKFWLHGESQSTNFWPFDYSFDTLEEALRNALRHADKDWWSTLYLTFIDTDNKPKCVVFKYTPPK